MPKRLILFVLLLPFTAYGDSSAPLTESQVKDYIKTEIAIDKVQMDMKAHADQYDNVIQAFFAKRKAMLNKRGWSVDEYETLQKRITGAVSAMEMEEDLDNDDEIQQMRENEYFPEDKKQQMIDAMEKMREKQRTQFITPTKPDWPAVKPYRDDLEQLTDWYAGNTPNPPSVE